MTEITQEQQISVCRACKIVQLDRSVYYYQPHPREDTPVEEKLMELAEEHPTWGFPEYFKRIRKQGLKWNHKRVKRVYCKLGLNMRRKSKKRVPNPDKEHLVQPLFPDITWSADFMSDSLENGRRFRTFNVIDDFNREALVIDVGFSTPAQRVVKVLEELIETRGVPEQIRTDNGPEFLSGEFQDFCRKYGIRHIRVQKGKPMQNGFVERFNGSYRRAILDAYLFRNLGEVRDQTEWFIEDYNNHHPHDSLADMTPIEFYESRKTG